MPHIRWAALGLAIALLAAGPGLDKSLPQETVDTARSEINGTGNRLGSPGWRT